jgi:hypothetical protein
VLAYRAMPWDVFLTLPNLVPPVPTPFESDGVALCSSEDERLADLAGNRGNATACRMLSNFRTTRGERFKPGCLVMQTTARPEARDAEAIRAFRNLCAVATTTHAWAIHVARPDRAQWTVQWSDQFFFGYFASGRNGWVQTLDGAVRGMDDAIPASQPSPQFGNPRNWSVRVDTPLLKRLLICWRRHYLQHRQRRLLRRLFRSLEVAFHAAMFPADGLTGVNDIGTRIALWVSAFEVLCHPGTRNVNKRDVQAVLRSVAFGDRTLNAERYTVSYMRTKYRATLVEALYDDLYAARNFFLHGMPVTGSTLHYRASARYVSLVRVAPVLYALALLTFLEGAQVPGGPMHELPLGNVRDDVARFMASRQGIRELQRALLAARAPVR